MKKEKVFIIGDNDEWLKAMARNFSINFPDLKESQKMAIHKISEHFELLEVYDSIKNSIESNGKEFLYPEIVVILGLIQIKQMEELSFLPNFLDRTNEKRFPLFPLMGMLVSTFPEIRWFFYNPFSCLNSNSKDIKHFKEIYPSNLKERLKETENLFFVFDPLGIRENIKDSFLKNLESKKLLAYILPRDKLATSVDEEASYAFLHGYLAYKFGYRCLLVTTQEMMELLSKPKEKEERLKCDIPFIDLAFEDLFLNFPDRSQDNTHLSDLSKRDEKYERLKDVSKRVLVTVGHKNIGWYRKNQDYIKELRAKGKKVKVVYKPSSGMYNILEKSGLLKEYWKRRKKEWNRAKPRLESFEEIGGHSAPGRLLIIAGKLIDRARLIFKEAETVQDCIQGATLALDAIELLRYRTPTTALEAIALKHKLEVRAECMFYGVEYNIDVKNRIREIKNEVKAVSLWFHSNVRKRSVLDAQMRIITDITRIFRDAGQFDEDLCCIKYLRKLNRRWSLKERGFKKFLNYLIYPLRSYIETLLASFPLFCLALVGWPTFFGILGKITGANFGKHISYMSPLTDYISNAFFTFFGLQPSGFPGGDWAHILTTLLIFGGFLHLGIFISHLYTLITRR